jgi:hypothetical protein
MKAIENGQTIYKIVECLDCVAVLMYIVEKIDAVWVQKTWKVPHETTYNQPYNIENQKSEDEAP